MNTNFIHFFEEALLKLREEISAYQDEANLWRTAPGISNSGGNLCMHLEGNLKHFIGMAIGDIPYTRDRDREFAAKNIPRAALLEQIDETTAVVRNTLERIEDMDQPFPEGLFPEAGSIEFYLLRLLAHLNYHLGQINYHRRLLE